MVPVNILSTDFNLEIISGSFSSLIVSKALFCILSANSVDAALVKVIATKLAGSISDLTI